MNEATVWIWPFSWYQRIVALERENRELRKTVAELQFEARQGSVRQLWLSQRRTLKAFPEL